MPTPRRRTGARTPAARRKVTASRAKGFRCPDCDFVAKHAMGLGRHRSTRHGVLSQRQQRRDAAGGWLTRREAARRANVHYNTIRHWEQDGRLRRARRTGAKGTLVSAADLERLVGLSRRTAGDVDGGRIQALERRFNELIAGLERLVSTARASSTSTPKARSRAKR